MSMAGAASRLLVVGASVRAAAWSARRAGLEPFGVDRFGDLDLRACCPVRVVSSRGEDARPGWTVALEAAAAAAPPGPWLYTGPLENEPELVERIGRDRPLWGCRAAELRRVRDPFLVAGCLQANHIPHPAVARPGQRLPAGHRWLLKPLRSAGGGGHRLLRSVSDQARTAAGHGNGSATAAEAGPNAGRQLDQELLAEAAPVRVGPAAADPDRHGRSSRAAGLPSPSRYYLQQFIAGQPCAAVFVGNASSAVLLGVTRQLVGEPAFHARRFQYCGSVGPVELDRPALEHCKRAGQVIAAEFALRGLFGIDGVLADAAFWPVEVNPRYTASVELLEFAHRLPALALHRSACEYGQLPHSPAAVLPAAAGAVFGKAILFAPRHLTVPDDISVPGSPTANPWSCPPIADVPAPGTIIEAGQPVLTVFASGGSVAACYAALVAQAGQLYDTLLGL